MLGFGALRRGFILNRVFPVTAVCRDAGRELIAKLAMQYRLPSMYGYRLFVESGGLASYGNDPVDLSRRAASYVDRILNGEKPRNPPVQLPRLGVREHRACPIHS